MENGRPRPLVALACALGLPALALLVVPASRAADEFRRDQTTLPESVSGATKDTREQVVSDGGGQWVRLVVGLFVVILVLWAFYWLLKQWTRSKGGVRGDGRMTVVATTALAQNRTLHLVRVGDDLILVGSSQEQVTPIHVYSGEDARRLEAAVDAPEPPRRGGPAGPGGPSGGSLVDRLRRVTTRH